MVKLSNLTLIYYVFGDIVILQEQFAGYTVPTELNGDMRWGIVCVRRNMRDVPEVRQYDCSWMSSGANGWHINFGQDYFKHVDKASSPTNFHLNRQFIFPSFSRWNILIDYIGKFVLDFLANGDRRGKHCYCQHIESPIRPFDWYIYIWNCPILKIEVSHLSIANISEKVTDMINILQQTNRTSHMDFSLA